MPVSASVTLERKGLLQRWLNEVLELCPAVDQIPPLDEFLTADDDSLDPSLMAKLLPPAPDSPAAVAAAVVGDTGRNGGHKALPAVLTVEGAAAAEAKAQAKAQALAQVSRTAPSPAALAPHADRCAGPGCAQVQRQQARDAEATDMDALVIADDDDEIGEDEI